MNADLLHVQKQARFAGFLYLIIVILGFYGIMYVTSQIMVIGDVSATYQNLLDNELLFRSGTFAHLINTVVFTMMVLVFYQLFEGIDGFLSKLMVAFVILHLSFEFGAEAMNFTALMIAKGHFLESLELTQRQEWVYLFLRMSKIASVNLSIVFWGLWLLPLGILVYKSGFIPKLFGVLLLAGGTAYIIEGTHYILFPGPKNTFINALFIVYAISEISFMLWLLLKGAKGPKSSVI